MDTESLIIPNGEKRIIERSASYPGISLQNAILFSTDISRSFPSSQVVTREDIAATLNKSVSSIFREVAACVQFDLFKKDKEGYKISPLLKTIQNYLSEDEKTKNLIHAFSSPKLYAELIEKFNGHVIPKELKTHLIRFHKIAEKVAQSAADTFLESGIFVGVINPENSILNLNGIIINKEKEPVHKEAETIVQNTVLPIDEGIGKEIIVNKKEQILIPEILNEEKAKIRLTENKFCYLIYPNNLNQKDVMIIRKQVEMLEILTG